jgi:uncharacterized protein YbjT (DUF2867 family)
MKKLTTIILVVSILAVTSPALAGDGDRGFGATVDILLVRPVSFAATVVGTAVFIVSLPFSIPSKSVGATAKTLVAEPFNYTFTRPVGVFNERELARMQGEQLQVPVVEKSAASDDSPKE